MNTGIKTTALVLSLSIIAITLSGCADNPPPPSYASGVYSDDQVMRAQHVQFGRITHMRVVSIRTHTKGNQTAGTAIGAIAGGILGSAFGGGNGKIATTVIGAAAGGAIGHQASKSRTAYVRGVEFMIRLDNGSNISVVQEDRMDNYYLGQQVRILYSSGTTRIVPL